MQCLTTGVVGRELVKDFCPVRLHVLCLNCIRIGECVLCARANEASTLFPIASSMLRDLQLQTLAEQHASARHEEARSQVVRTRSGRLSMMSQSSP